MTTGKAEKAEIIKIMEFPNGRNIVHIPIRTPEEEARHHEELYKAAVRLLKAQERSKKRIREEKMDEKKTKDFICPNCGEMLCKEEELKEFTDDFCTNCGKNIASAKAEAMALAVEDN